MAEKKDAAAPKAGTKETTKKPEETTETIEEKPEETPEETTDENSEESSSSAPLVDAKSLVKELGLTPKDETPEEYVSPGLDVAKNGGVFKLSKDGGYVNSNGDPCDAKGNIKKK